MNVMKIETTVVAADTEEDDVDDDDDKTTGLHDRQNNDLDESE